MVDGIHKYLDRELAAAAEQARRSSGSRLRVAGGARASRSSRTATGCGRSSASSTRGCRRGWSTSADRTSRRWSPRRTRYKVYAVRWAVLPGVDARGAAARADRASRSRNVVAVPDADQTPGADRRAGRRACRTSRSSPAGWPRTAAASSCPTLIDRKDDLSGEPEAEPADEPAAPRVRLPHGLRDGPHAHRVRGAEGARGRGLVRREQRATPPVGVIGLRRGRADRPVRRRRSTPRIAVVAVERATSARGRAAGRSRSTATSGACSRSSATPSCGRWSPRGSSIVGRRRSRPEVAGPPAPRPGRGGAAPGRLADPDVRHDAESTAVDRADPRPRTRAITRRRSWPRRPSTSAAVRTRSTASRASSSDCGRRRKHADDAPARPPQELRPRRPPEAAVRPTRRVHAEALARLGRRPQGVLEEGRRRPRRRRGRSRASGTATTSTTEVIGKLPDPTMPLNPRTRQVYDEPKWTGYEVVLDVYPDVFAYGILLLAEGPEAGREAAGRRLPARPRRPADGRRSTPRSGRSTTTFAAPARRARATSSTPRRTRTSARTTSASSSGRPTR